MLEKDLERKLVRAVRESGGLALKFVSPGMAGVPDRLLLSVHEDLPDRSEASTDQGDPADPEQPRVQRQGRQRSGC